MKLNTLRDFRVIAEHCSLRGAARSLGTAQSSLSRTIHDLERELGVALFERHGRGVQLTSHGEVFRRRAAAVNNNLERALEEIDQLRADDARGRVSVCMTNVSNMTLLSRVLKPFRQRYPGVMLNVVDGVYPQVEAALLNGTVDGYVGPLGEVPPDEIAVETLFRNRRVVVCRKGHPLAAARSLGELVDAEWITMSISHAAEEEVGPLFAGHGLPPPRLAMKAQSALAFLTAIVEGDMLMLLAAQWMQAPRWSDHVQMIDVVEALPASPDTCLVYRSGHLLTPAARYLFDLLRVAALEAGGSA